MKYLNEIEGKTVIVLETSANAEEKKYLHNIGITAESLVSVVKNNKNSNNPLLIEVDNARFMIDKDLAKKIYVDDMLSQQEIIFSGNKTRQRDLILEVIQKESGHFSLKECIAHVQSYQKEKGETQKIGGITVYRVIKVLKEKNILDEIVLPSGEKQYEIHKGHHDHIFCKNCGNIIEFYSEEIERLQNEIAHKYGVELYSHSLVMIGLQCEKCR